MILYLLINSKLAGLSNSISLIIPLTMFKSFLHLAATSIFTYWCELSKLEREISNLSVIYYSILHRRAAEREQGRHAAKGRTGWETNPQPAARTVASVHGPPVLTTALLGQSVLNTFFFWGACACGLRSTYLTVYLTAFINF